MKRITSFLLAIVLFAGFVLTGTTTVYAASQMSASDDVVEIIKKYEGFHAKPYWDQIQYTVGYGTRCPDDKLEEYQENGISKEEAEALLRKYIASTEKAVNQRMIDKNSLTLTQGQFDALVSFSYNCGTAWMSDTDSNLYKSIVSGATGSKLIDAFARWSKAGGKILTGLVNRRLSEANMYLNQKYSRTPPENYCYVILDANGGDVASTIQGYDADEAVKIYYTPTYTGREFKGWYTAKTGGSKVTTLKQSHSGTTLYARWTEAEDQEETTPINITVTVTSNDVNLRTGPGTNYSKAGTADKGDKLTITEIASGSGYTWGKSGDVWVALEFTDYETVTKDPEDDKTEDTTTPTDPPADEEVDNTKVTGKVSTKALIVREGPGSNYDIVKKLKQGDKVTITQRKTINGIVWGKISDGWISVRNVELDAPTTDEAVDDTTVTGTVKTKKLVVRKGPGSDYDVVKYLKQDAKVTITQRKTINDIVWGKISDGWISVRNVEPDAPTTDETVDNTKVTGTVKTKKLVVRKGPGSDYDVVKYLKQDAKVTITQRKTINGIVWGKISDGWISVRNVELDAPAADETVDNTKLTGKVNLDNLPVRKEPKSDSTVVKKLKKGTKVTITQRKTVDGVVWAKISDGWISFKRVTVDEPTSTTITATVKVSSGRLTVRKGAGTSYAVVKYLSNGTKVTITKTKTVSGTKWGYIGDGWISMDYVVVK